MRRMLIVADDLSGAADCAIACTAAGLDALVVLGGTSGDGADVLAVDANTRRLAPAAAARRTFEAFCDHVGAVTPILFKKLDSSLRGNIAAELRAGLEFAGSRGAGRALAIVAPAFPALGRTTRGGQQRISGVPVEATELWRREGIAGTAHVPTMIERAGLRTRYVDLPTVRDGDALRDALHGACIDHDAVVCDAETEADLAAIATAGITLGAQTLWAGAAGLARHLAAGMTPRPSTDGAAGIDRSAIGPVNRPILFVVGSLSSVSRRQVEMLAAEGECRLVTVAPRVLRMGASAPGWAEARDRIGRQNMAGVDLIVMLGLEDRIDLAEGLALCSALAQLVAPFADQFGAVVSTGGETARAVMEALGTSALRLIGEVEAGVPLATIEQPSGPWHRLPIITKAGAFGQPDTLLRCRAALRAPAAFAASVSTGGSQE